MRRSAARITDEASIEQARANTRKAPIFHPKPATLGAVKARLSDLVRLAGGASCSVCGCIRLRRRLGEWKGPKNADGCNVAIIVFDGKQRGKIGVLQVLR